MRATTAIIFACGLALGGCAVDEAEDVGGIDQELVGSPQGPTIAATVELYFLTSAGAAQSACTGTALTDHWILTAAHCVAGWPADERLDVRAADASGAATL